MGETKGYVAGLILFVMFLFPAILTFGIDSFHQHTFLKVTTETSEMVKGEGGVSENVKNVVERLEQNGFEITFEDEEGNAVDGIVDYGTNLKINYKFNYQGVFNMNELQSTNEVFILRRSGNETSNL